MKRISFVLLFLMIFVSCVSTKSTLRNVDNAAPDLVLNTDGNFVISKYSKNSKYGYDKDFPINVFFQNTKDTVINQQRFLNALAGPNGEKLNYKKLDECCPFPTKRSDIGVGLLHRYEVSWIGQTTPVILYFNIFEKGVIEVPVGLTLK